MLNLSEAELLATKCEKEVTRLDHTKVKEIIKEIKNLGNIMALSRNEYVVSELKGSYGKAHIGDSSIGYIAGDIELTTSENALLVDNLVYSCLRRLRIQSTDMIAFWDDNNIAWRSLQMNIIFGHPHWVRASNATQAPIPTAAER